MSRTAPGKSNRIGISLLVMMGCYPDERVARDFFAVARLGKGGERRACPHCQSDRTVEAPGPTWQLVTRSRVFGAGQRSSSA